MDVRGGLAALAALMVAAGQAAAADEVIDVGGAAITIPDPPGFTRVTPEMVWLHDMIESLTPPRHTRYLAYVPQELAEGALENQVQEYLSLLTVQDVAGIGDMGLSPDEFARVKESIRSQNDEVLRELTPDDLGEGADPHIPTALRTAGYVPLPMHAETDRSAAFTAFMRTTAPLSGGEAGSKTMAATMTVIHARSRALLLNVGVIDGELEWAQDFSARWAEAILAANAEPAASTP